jgi:hypothetical protein
MTVPPFESEEVYAYGTQSEAWCARDGIIAKGDPEQVEKAALDHLLSCKRGLVRVSRWLARIKTIADYRQAGEPT